MRPVGSVGKIPGALPDTEDVEIMKMAIAYNIVTAACANKFSNSNNIEQSVIELATKMYLKVYDALEKGEWPQDK